VSENFKRQIVHILPGAQSGHSFGSWQANIAKRRIESGNEDMMRYLRIYHGFDEKTTTQTSILTSLHAHDMIINR
jgi:hypothetical protein